MLYAVMKVLEVKDLLSVMHTCRILYRHGVPLILENVRYTHARHDHLLYRHLLLSDLSRFTHIRSLACDYMDHVTQSAIPSTSGLFAEFLHRATQLQALDITFASNIDIDTDALAPIAALPRLRTLRLRRCTDWAPLAELLGSITTPLSAFTICTRPSIAHLAAADLNAPSLPPPPVDVLGALVRFRDSLVELELEVLTDMVPPAPTRGATFPHVQRLAWRCKRAITAPVLAALFPALRELSVLGTALYPRHAVPPGTQWSTLMRVQGDCHDVAALGLRCPIRELALDATGVGGEDPEVHADVTDILRATRPERIVIALREPSRVLELGTLITYLHADLRELELAVDIALGESALSLAALHLVSAPNAPSVQCR